MIDPCVEDLVGLSAAARILNRTNPPHSATVWRWALSGVAGVRLESMKIGGVRYTSRQACARFLAALNEPGTVPEPPTAAAQRAGAALVGKGC